MASPLFLLVFLSSLVLALILHPQEPPGKIYVVTFNSVVGCYQGQASGGGSGGFDLGWVFVIMCVTRLSFSSSVRARCISPLVCVVYLPWCVCACVCVCVRSVRMFLCLSV